MLESNKCYMLDADTQIFVWMGRATHITERKTSISAAEVLCVCVFSVCNFMWMNLDLDS